MKDKVTKYNSDITSDDLQALGDKQENLRNDNGEDRILKNRINPVDFSGNNLDVPGRVKVRNQTKKKLKDEENQLYSLGSGDNENLEIDTITYNNK